MANKIILFNEQALKALKRGVNLIADAVKITIGPKGRNVIIDRGFGTPLITNDGVSIAKEISVEDKFVDMGVEIVKEVAEKTNDIAGDGTTTSIILTQAMVNEGLKKVGMGLDPLNIRRGIENAVSKVLELLKKKSQPIRTDEEIKQIATISAESEEIGKIIGEIIKKVGINGVVTVEESQTMGIESEIVEGLQFDRGYVSPYMITNPERMEAVVEEPYILVTDQKISNVKEILPLLESVAQTGKKDLVIIADEIEGDALATFVVNKLRGIFNILGVKAPGYGDRKKELLEDIAITCGAKVISPELGMKLENANVSHLGKAHKIIATKDNTVIVGGKGEKEKIHARIEQLKKLRAQAESKFDIEKLEERIAKLAGGVAIIKVGAPTEAEMKYLKLKIEDAVNATKAAIEEGIIIGGGSALVKVAHEMENHLKNENYSDEILAGYSIVINSLKQPLAQIAKNAGKDAGVIIDLVTKGGENNGYDAQKDRIVPDMFKEGIIDPFKVARVAIQNSSSAAAMLLTSCVAVAEAPKKEEPHSQKDHFNEEEF